MLYKLVRLIVKVICLILFHASSNGADNLKKVKGVIFAVNHCSLLDPQIVSVLSPRPLYFLAQQKVFQFKLTGFLLPRINVMQVNREEPEISVFKKIIKLLKQGNGVVLFPEGTRSCDGNLQPAKYGVGLLAVKAGVPIIPGYVKGTFKAWSRHMKYIRPAKVTLNVGEPISIEHWLKKNKTTKADYQEIADLVMEKIKELK